MLVYWRVPPLFLGKHPNSVVQAEFFNPKQHIKIDPFTLIIWSTRGPQKTNKKNQRDQKDMDVEPKILVFTPKMDGENSWEILLKWMNWGVPLYLETPILIRLFVFVSLLVGFRTLYRVTFRQTTSDLTDRWKNAEAVVVARGGRVEVLEASWLKRSP